MLLSLGGLAFAAWMGWFVLANVPVYETSLSARLEAYLMPHPVDAPLTGRVAAITARVGEPVHTGDIVVELDSSAERLAIKEEQRRTEGWQGELEQLLAAVRSFQAIAEERTAADAAGLAEMRARAREAEHAAKLGALHAQQIAQLHASESATAWELELARAEEAQRMEAAEAARLTVDRLAADQRVAANEHAARLDQLRGEVQRLSGQIETARATIHRLENDIELRRIRSPVDGLVGDLAPLAVGSVVREGARVATIIPTGTLKAVAEFPPAVIGRIVPGQKSRLRFDAFPWTQYGTVAGVVATVASEPRDGTVRVEFDLTQPTDTAIPLSHGLPGMAEVEVERVSPAVLVLRIVGRRETPPPVVAAAVAAVPLSLGPLATQPLGPSCTRSRR